MIDAKGRGLRDIRRKTEACGTGSTGFLSSMAAI